MDTKSTRLRAWALIRSNDPKSISEQIWGHDQDDGRIVVVRVDILKDSQFNLIVPFDMTPGSKKEVLELLDKYCGSENYEFAVVDYHNPNPAQNASGFITDAELSRGEKREGVKAGRQDNSPGFNPWG